VIFGFIKKVVGAVKTAVKVVQTVVAVAKKIYDALTAAREAAKVVFSIVKKVMEACATCPKKDMIKLVELVEVVERKVGASDKMGEGSVTGPGKESSDKEKHKFKVDRTAKDGGDWKQHINIGKGIEGTDKRNPAHEQYVEVRARVEWAGGDKTRSLSGKKVYFACKCDKGGDSRPANLQDGEDFGFGAAGGAEKDYQATTDEKGWTNVVKFYVSKYGGDKFTITAKADEKDVGKGTGTELKIEKYIVWRKFWYQLSRATGYAAPLPANAVAAYAKVKAEMVHAETRDFTRADLSDDLKDRTFMKEWMVKQGGADRDVAVIGVHNVDDLRTHVFREEAHRPIKAHLVATEYQCDAIAGDESDLEDYEMTTNPKSFTVPSGRNLVCKPPLRPGQNLVSSGEYGRRNPAGVFNRLGAIADANVTIERTRANVKEIKVTLPAGAPAPTVANPIILRLKVWTAGNYLGVSHNGNVVCVYRPTAAAGTQGSEGDYNNTVIHETGHSFNQTPTPGNEPQSLNAHPEQYIAHGGSGSHCSDAATTKPANDQRNVDTDVPEVVGGTCVMFHSFNAACINEYCDTCKPYLRLQDMSRFS